MNAAEIFTSIREGSLSAHKFVYLMNACVDLADAADKLGACSSRDSAREDHWKHCARCAVKRALAEYRRARE